MHHLTLPQTDLRVSNICFGTADLGADVPETESFGLLDQFFEAGGNFLDTAAIYADWTSAGKGSSERLLGKWLQSRQKPAIIATKGAHPELTSLGVGRMTKQDIEADLEQSLRNLGLETIDLYYLHRDDESVAVEDILQILEGCVAAGKIRYYACSNWKTARIQAAQNAAKASGAAGFVANQPLWSLAEVDLSGGDQTLAPMTTEMRAFHAQSGMAAIPYSSQANGYFQKIAAGREIQGMVRGFYDAATRGINRARGEQIEKIGRESGLTSTQVVLGYLLCQPFSVVPIVGCKNAAQLADSLSAADVQLSAAQLATLENPS